MNHISTAVELIHCNVGLDYVEVGLSEMIRAIKVIPFHFVIECLWIGSGKQKKMYVPEQPVAIIKPKSTVQ